MSDFVRFSNAERKASGAHYTPTPLAKFIAQHLVTEYRGALPHVLDPAAGDGELLLAMLEEMGGKARATGFDTDAAALDAANGRLKGAFPDSTIDLHREDFLSVALSHRDGGLFAPSEKFDIVISNPPYVRTQVLGAERAQQIAKQFDLSGRVDLYYAFIEGIADVLRPGGLAGVIVSNRFITTKAGTAVRSRILERFEILHLWDLGDTKIFEAAVLPAVLLLRKKEDNESPSTASKFSSIYTTQEESDVRADTVYEALSMSGRVSVQDRVYNVEVGTLDTGTEPGSVWRLATASADKWLSTVQHHTFCTFGEIGKIRVGVKTTADKIFVRKDWDEIPPDQRPETLRPLVTHHVARRYRALPADSQIAYTHEEVSGKRRAICLSEHPKAERYFEAHREALTSRNYVIKAGREWFEIWVPQQPAFWRLPKLVFPDISEKPMFWMSLSDEVIQGDCYWIPAETPAQQELLWLALAVANSRFIEEFYDHACRNKLYAGRRRFMTQYVERFPVPNPESTVCKLIVEKVKRIFEQTPSDGADALANEIEELVKQAFGVSKEITGQRDLALAI